MTEAGLPDRPEGDRSEFSPYIQAWSESFAQVLGQISASPLPCLILTDSPPELPPAGERDLWIVGVCSGGLRGEMSLRLPAVSVVRLVQIFMSEPAGPAAGLSSAELPSAAAEATSEQREAAVELLRQVAGLVVTAIKPLWGEVQLRLDPAAAAPSWTATASSKTWLRVGEDKALSPLVEMHLSAALAAAMRAEKPATAKPPAAADSSSGPPERMVKLDLLLDVELAVTLRFGSRRMLLREVLELIPGAVVDLDRQVQDPIDVLLDGRLVARGEVVVLNGNYGLRVTEVVPAGPA